MLTFANTCSLLLSISFSSGAVTCDTFALGIPPTQQDGHHLEPGPFRPVAKASNTGPIDRQNENIQ